MGESVVILLILAVIAPNADCLCSFPSDLVGAWYTSTMGTITFTTSTVTIPSVYTYGNIVFNCETLDGSKYILRSTTTVTILNNQLDVITCFDGVTQLTESVKYKLQHATGQLADASNWRIKVIPTGNSVATSSICTETTPYGMGTQDILLKTDSVSRAYVQCPDALLGRFTYTYDSGSGNVCTASSYIDVCTDRTKIIVDLSLCSQKVAYSSGGIVYCVYSQSTTTKTVVNLYNADANPDGSATYRFTCLVVSSSSSIDNVVYVSESKQVCEASQTSTSVTSGATLVLTSSYTCVPMTGPGTMAASAGMIAGIIVALLVIAGVVALVVILKLKKKKIVPNSTTEKSSIATGTFKSVGDIENDANNVDATVVNELNPTTTDVQTETEVIGPRDATQIDASDSTVLRLPKLEASESGDKDTARSGNDSSRSQK